MAQQLPTLRYRNREYVIDLRLQELRNVDKPQDSLQLTAEEVEYLKEKLPASFLATTTNG